MTTNFHVAAAALAATLLAATPAAAQTAARGESVVQGAALVTADCLLTPRSYVAQVEGAALAQESFGALAAGFAGQLASGGLTALGGLLEEAAREHAFNVAAQTSYAFYGFGEIVPDRPGLASPVPRRSLCLTFAAAEPGPGGRSSGDTLPDLVLRGPEGQQVSSTGLEGVGLPRRPALYVEAFLEQHADGFTVRPVLIWYRTPVTGAPNRPLPAELHVTFSTPASAGTEAINNATFAVARIPLGPLRPRSDEFYGFDELRLMASPVLPLRPTTGATATLAAALSAVETELTANAAELRTLARQLPRARAAAEAPGAKAEGITAYQVLLDRQAEAERLTPLLQERRLSLRQRARSALLGSTNVQVRLALVRNPNRFLAAVGAALKGQATAAGTAVTRALTPETRADAWTTSDTAYIQAMTVVEQRQAECDLAVIAGDPARMLAAELALRNARAAANQAAALSDRILPFPDLL